MSYYRRVHISADTLKCLNDVYEVEPGYGCERDNYLKDRNVVTYLIKQVEPLKSRRRQSSKPKVWTEEELAANKNKKSFKVNNPHAVNSNEKPPDDDIGVDWTPEIPFENVNIKIQIRTYPISNKSIDLLIEFIITQQTQSVTNVTYFARLAIVAEHGYVSE